MGASELVYRLATKRPWGKVYIFGGASSSLLSLALYYHISTIVHQAPSAFILKDYDIIQSSTHFTSIPREELKKPNTGIRRIVVEVYEIEYKKQ